MTNLPRLDKDLTESIQSLKELAEIEGFENLPEFLEPITGKSHKDDKGKKDGKDCNHHGPGPGDISVPFSEYSNTKIYKGRFSI